MEPFRGYGIECIPAIRTVSTSMPHRVVTQRVDAGVQLQTAPGLNHTDGWTNECDVVLEPSLPVLH